MKNFGFVVLAFFVLCIIGIVVSVFRDYWAWNVEQANKKEAAASAKATTSKQYEYKPL